MTTSRQEAERRLIADIESSGVAKASEFDIEAILTALYELVGHWDFDTLEAEDFWPVVQRHARDNTALGEYPDISFLDRAATERLAGLVNLFQSDGVDRQTAIASLRRVVATLT